jgi:hypothetical protein
MVASVSALTEHSDRKPYMARAVSAGNSIDGSCRYRTMSDFLKRSGKRFERPITISENTGVRLHRNSWDSEFQLQVYSDL